MVVSSDSRPLPKAEAQHKVSAAVKQLQARGAHYFTKRIDTTLRGGIGFEIDAMLGTTAAGDGGGCGAGDAAVTAYSRRRLFGD